MSDENGNSEYGTVRISDDVVINMARIATISVKGVYVARTGIVDGITSLFPRRYYSKGIKVEVNENTVSLDIYINVEYGNNINGIARNVQSAVKKEIEDMTDLSVSAVNVHVLKVVLENENEIPPENTDTNT